MTSYVHATLSRMLLVCEYLRAIARSLVIEGEPGCDRMAVPCSCCTVMLCRKSAVSGERKRGLRWRKKLQGGTSSRVAGFGLTLILAVPLPAWF